MVIMKPKEIYLKSKCDRPLQEVRQPEPTAEDEFLDLKAIRAAVQGGNQPKTALCLSRLHATCDLIRILTIHTQACGE